MDTIDLLLWFIAAYAAVGVLFSLAFVTFGAGRVDPGARGASLAFRVVILPGAAALWPWLLRRWVAGPMRETGDARR